MVTIKKRSELLGAEKFGSCASCGCGTDEKEIFKLEFDDLVNSKAVLSLCSDCIGDMKNKINNKDGKFIKGKTGVYVEDRSIIYSIARSFYDSATILGLFSGEFFDPENCQSINPKFKIPQIVIKALSAEIFLKSLTYNDKQVCDGHELYKLFNLITESLQDEIIAETYNVMKATYHKRSCNNEEFYIDLAEISKTFNNWRYIYENETNELDFQFFDAFVAALCLVVGKLVKDENQV